MVEIETSLIIVESFSAFVVEGSVVSTSNKISGEAVWLWSVSVKFRIGAVVVCSSSSRVPVEMVVSAIGEEFPTSDAVDTEEPLDWGSSKLVELLEAGLLS